MERQQTSEETHRSLYDCGGLDNQSELEEFLDIMRTLRIPNEPFTFLHRLAHWMHAWKDLELSCAQYARLSAPLASLAALARSLRASCHVERLKPP